MSRNFINRQIQYSLSPPFAFYVKKFHPETINMHNPRVSLLFALSHAFPRGADGKASLPLQFVRRTAVRRWENKIGSLFHLRVTFPIDVKPCSPIVVLSIQQRRNSLLATNE